MYDFIVRARALDARRAKIGIRPLVTYTAIAALLTACGCAQVTIRSGDQVTTKTGFGLGAMTLDHLTNPVSITTRGVGLISGMGHLTLGFLDQEVVAFPDASQCRLLVVVNALGEMEAVIEALEASHLTSDGVCIQRSHIL